MTTLLRASIIEALTIVEKWTHADITRLLLQFGLEDLAPAGTASRRDRANTLMRFLQQNPEETGPSGEPLAFEIVEYVVISKLQSDYYWDDTPIEEQIPKLAALLRRDGYNATKNGIEAIGDIQPLANESNKKSEVSANQRQMTVEQTIENAPIKYRDCEEEISNLKLLIGNHKRRLQKLREQEAVQGISADPKIAIEIEDIEAKIAKLKADLENIETNTSS